MMATYGTKTLKKKDPTKNKTKKVVINSVPMLEPDKPEHYVESNFEPDIGQPGIEETPAEIEEFAAIEATREFATESAIEDALAEAAVENTILHKYVNDDESNFESNFEKVGQKGMRETPAEVGQKGKEDNEELEEEAEEEESDEEGDEEEEKAEQRENPTEVGERRSMRTNPAEEESHHILQDEEDDDESDTEDEPYLQKFQSELNKKYLENIHPECVRHNNNEVLVMTQVVRDEYKNIVDSLHRTLPYLTKYEKARVIGQRAKQIDMGATIFIDVDSKIIDGYIIAEMELMARKIPFIIRRPIPGGGSEYWNLKDLDII